MESLGIRPAFVYVGVAAITAVGLLAVAPALLVSLAALVALVGGGVVLVRSAAGRTGLLALRLAQASLVTLAAIPASGAVAAGLVSVAVFAWLLSTFAALVVGLAALSDPEERAHAKKALLRAGLSFAVVGLAIGAVVYALSQATFTF